MKIKSLKLFLFIGILSINTLALSADRPQHFINDSILNKSNTKISVQVKFNKLLNMDLYSRSNRGYVSTDPEKLKKYAAQTKVTQTIKYDLEPNKEVSIYKEFIDSNPLSDNEFWSPSALTIAADGLNINISVGGIPEIGEELIKSKKYLVTVLSNGLKVETENTLK